MDTARIDAVSVADSDIYLVFLVILSKEWLCFLESSTDGALAEVAWVDGIWYDCA